MFGVLLATAVGAISSVAASIATGITAVGVALGPALQALMTTIQTWGPIIELITKVILPTFMSPNQSVEELGARALQTKYDVDKFDSFEEYMEALQEVELDPQIEQEYSLDQRQLIGALLCVRGLSESGIELGYHTLENIGSGAIEQAVIERCIAEYQNGSFDLKALEFYLAGEDFGGKEMVAEQFEAMKAAVESER